MAFLTTLELFGAPMCRLPDALCGFRFQEELAISSNHMPIILVSLCVLTPRHPMAVGAILKPEEPQFLT